MQSMRFDWGEKQDIFTCKTCGAKLSERENAARNVLARGIDGIIDITDAVETK